MKSLLALLLAAFSLLLLSRSSDARKGPFPAAEEYWEMMMKGDPMPQAISGLIVRSGDREEPSAAVVEEDIESSRSRFVRDFDVRPNAIIYHNHKTRKNEEKGFFADGTVGRS